MTLALALVACAGCGSSNQVQSDTSISPSGPPSSGVFSADINALCRQAHFQLQHLSGGPPERVAIYARYLPKFKALSPSPSAREADAEFVANFEKAVRDLKAGRFGSANEDVARNRALALEMQAPACSWHAGGY